MAAGETITAIVQEPPQLQLPVYGRTQPATGLYVQPQSGMLDTARLRMKCVAQSGESNNSKRLMREGIVLFKAKGHPLLPQLDRHHHRPAPKIDC